MSQIWDSTIPATNVNILEDNIHSRQNEESLRSNFDGDTAPSNPSVGQTWHKTSNNIEYTYTGTGSFYGGWEESGNLSTTGKDVIAAKGTKASLKERLDVALNDNGTLKVPAEYNYSEWVNANSVVTYVSSSQLKVNNDMTDVYKGGRNVKLTLNDASVVYLQSASSTYDSASDTTTITFATSGVTDTISKIEYSILLESYVNLKLQVDSIFDPIVAALIFG
jgi:hypothetical protein